MQIKNIIFASDDSGYLDFWKINSEICVKRLGLEPFLFHITDEESDFHTDKFGIIKKVKSVPGYPTCFQAQIIRMYATRYFLTDVCLMSDIDMFLFDRNYVHKTVRHIPDDDFVIYSSDAYDSSRPECVGEFASGRYPICYVAGKGITFRKVLGTDCSFVDYIKNFCRFFDQCTIADELYFSQQVDSFNHGVKVHKLKRGYSSNFHLKDRIEKTDFSNSAIFSLNLRGKINLDGFIDCHCPNYKDNESLIMKVANQILGR